MIRRPPRSTLFPTRRSSDLIEVRNLTKHFPIGAGLLGVGRDAVKAVDDVSFSIRRGETRSEEHTSELQSQSNLVCRLLLEKKKKMNVLLHAYSYVADRFGG